jgi:ribonuclease P protein component
VFKKDNKLPAKTRLKNASVLASSFFTVKFSKNQNQEKRFAIIIGKIVDKRAVYRNKLRRRIKEALGQIIKNIKTGYDFLIIAKQQSVSVKTEEIGKELLRIFKEGKLIT